MPQRRRPCLRLTALLCTPCRLVEGLYDPVRHTQSAEVRRHHVGASQARHAYAVEISVGTPPQVVLAALDMQSQASILRCSGCKGCGRQGREGSYDISLSSSSRWVPCSVAEGCFGDCRFGRCAYPLGSTASHLARGGSSEDSPSEAAAFDDRVQLGSFASWSPAVQHRLACRLSKDIDVEIYSTVGIAPPPPATDAVFGAKVDEWHASGHEPPRSLLEELFQDRAHIEQRVFALCLGLGGGRFMVGGFNGSFTIGPVQYTALSLTGGNYGVMLQAIQIEGSTVGARLRAAVVDVGQTVTTLATSDYRQLDRAISDSVCGRLRGCSDRRGNACWSLLGEQELRLFPDIVLVFTGARVPWTPRAYLQHVGKPGEFCYAFKDGGESAGTVLGASWMLHQELTFDLRSNRVAMAPASCPEKGPGSPLPVPRPDHPQGESLEGVEEPKFVLPRHTTTAAPTQRDRAPLKAMPTVAADLRFRHGMLGPRGPSGGLTALAALLLLGTSLCACCHRLLQSLSTRRQARHTPLPSWDPDDEEGRGGAE